MLVANFSPIWLWIRQTLDLNISFIWSRNWTCEYITFIPNGRRTHSNHHPIDSINRSRCNSIQRFTYILHILNGHNINYYHLHSFHFLLIENSSTDKYHLISVCVEFLKLLMVQESMRGFSWPLHRPKYPPLSVCTTRRLKVKLLPVKFQRKDFLPYNPSSSHFLLAVYVMS